jgi:hypothetical protein
LRFRNAINRNNVNQSSQIADEAGNVIVIAGKKEFQRARPGAKEQADFQTGAAFKNIVPEPAD